MPRHKKPSRLVRKTVAVSPALKAAMEQAGQQAIRDLLSSLPPPPLWRVVLAAMDVGQEYSARYLAEACETSWQQVNGAMGKLISTGRVIAKRRKFGTVYIRRV